MPFKEIAEDQREAETTGYGVLEVSTQGGGTLFRPFHPPPKEEAMVKVKLSEDVKISPDGINVVAGKSGEEHSVSRQTAETLVVEGKAEFSGEPAVKLQQKVDAGVATANEMSPQYGDVDHLQAIQDEQGDDPAKVVERRKKAKEKEGKS